SNSTGIRTAWLRPFRNNLTCLCSVMHQLQHMPQTYAKEHLTARRLRPVIPTPAQCLATARHRLAVLPRPPPPLRLRHGGAALTLSQGTRYYSSSNLKLSCTDC